MREREQERRRPIRDKALAAPGPQPRTAVRNLRRMAVEYLDGATALARSARDARQTDRVQQLTESAVRRLRVADELREG